MNWPPAECISTPAGGLFLLQLWEIQVYFWLLSAEVRVLLHEPFLIGLRETPHQLSLAATPIICPNNSASAVNPMHNNLSFTPQLKAPRQSISHLLHFSGNVIHEAIVSPKLRVGALEAPFSIWREGGTTPLGNFFGLEPTLPKNALHKSPSKVFLSSTLLYPRYGWRDSRFSVFSHLFCNSWSCISVWNVISIVIGLNRNFYWNLLL